MKTVDQILSDLRQREGPYCNNKNDAGGETCWGITVAVARANGYNGPMRDMPPEVADAIYLREYFIHPGFSKVFLLSRPIAVELLDTGVNMGAGLPGPWLQRILNVMNRQGADYADVKVDGSIGPATLAALATFLQKRGADGEKVMLRALNCLQGARYIEIAERREASETFIFGWFSARIA